MRKRLLAPLHYQQAAYFTDSENVSGVPYYLISFDFIQSKLCNEVERDEKTGANIFLMRIAALLGA